MKACCSGDVASAQAAVADGASVNAEGRASASAGDVWCPLSAAVIAEHNRYNLVVWLLSRGADPSRGDVMDWATKFGSPNCLQVLIDAGCDVNRDGRAEFGPIFDATAFAREGTVRVLLAQPSLDLTLKCRAGFTALQWAVQYPRPLIASLVAAEVS